ncbi:MAG TPA: TauD/TfdA family dioxygenase, partial [Casimicrobiaceae bacterium]|nr:TauD/TfdA family dioxygenase [Casimicrobiaceae bacterium]
STVDGAVWVAWAVGGSPASFDLRWLREHAPGQAERPAELAVRLWPDGAAMDAARDVAWLALPAFRSDAPARLTWMTRLVQEGIAFLSGVPSTERAILDAVAPMGFVIDTNYGRVFDVKSVPQPENLAYSDRGLGLHTDNPYRDPVPGFQALHCLIASNDGGENLFADGFAIAEHLRVTEPAVFATLTRTPVLFRYRSKDAELFSEKPLIQLSTRGEVRAVHYNNRSIAPLELAPAELGAFYAAYRRFAQLLREPRFQMHTKLRDGDLVVFDNRRTLHGRTGFSSARYPRHLQGCYLTRDSVLSETALLRRRLAVKEA